MNDSFRDTLIGPFGQVHVPGNLIIGTMDENSKRDADTLSHCKAWIDYRCADLRSGIGPLDDKGIVINPTVDAAMRVLAHNELLNLRLNLDFGSTPRDYPPAVQSIYINDSDMQRLRKLTGSA